MNLATLVSSLVLAASTATAGLLVAPTSLPSLASPQGGDGSSIDLGPVCIGACPEGNATDGNETAPPADNETAPPPPPQPDAEPEEEAAPAQTCSVDLEAQEEVEGPASLEWAWEVGTGTQNLTVRFEASGMWTPFGGGLHVRLTDGDGDTVASADDSGMGLPFSYNAIDYQGDDVTGLSHGLWHLTVEADGVLGGVWLQVHSEC
ncbi:MAG: hypothetical protein LC623_04210 [Halobacteriales archaeon]|nr:hypothetical protein [Halobacteriales archaeon]